MAMTQEEALQRAYYTNTAANYDADHVDQEPEHNLALSYISAMLKPLSIKSVLDVGCGTGRGVEQLRRDDPSLKVFGIDPVEALLKRAVAKGTPAAALIKGDACFLPFPDRSFDATVTLGVLHHVPRPEPVVRELMRVARKAVFISDGNIFGNGTKGGRVLKYLVYKAGLWNVAKIIQTRGRGYTITEGDGLAYSYSVYFQYEMLSNWASRVFLIPLMRDSRVIGLPPFDARCVLVGAVRDSDKIEGVNSAGSLLNR